MPTWLKISIHTLTHIHIQQKICTFFLALMTMTTQAAHVSCARMKLHILSCCWCTVNKWGQLKDNKILIRTCPLCDCLSTFEHQCFNSVKKMMSFAYNIDYWNMCFTAVRRTTLLQKLIAQSVLPTIRIVPTVYLRDALHCFEHWSRSYSNQTCTKNDCIKRKNKTPLPGSHACTTWVQHGMLCCKNWCFWFASSKFWRQNKNKNKLLAHYECQLNWLWNHSPLRMSASLTVGSRRTKHTSSTLLLFWGATDQCTLQTNIKCVWAQHTPLSCGTCNRCWCA